MSARGVSRPRPRGRGESQHALRQTATAADVTHPTGMHSCLVKILLFSRLQVIDFIKSKLYR